MTQTYSASVLHWPAYNFPILLWNLFLKMGMESSRMEADFNDGVQVFGYMLSGPGDLSLLKLFISCRLFHLITSTWLGCFNNFSKLVVLEWARTSHLQHWRQRQKNAFRFSAIYLSSICDPFTIWSSKDPTAFLVSFLLPMYLIKILLVFISNMFPIVMFCLSDHWLEFYLPSLCSLLSISLRLSRKLGK